MTRGKHQNQSAPNTGVNGLTTGRRSSSELGDIGDHVNKLRQVTLTTQALVGLLGGQLQGLSVTIPLLRGFEIVRANFVSLFRLELGRAVGGRIHGAFEKML